VSGTLIKGRVEHFAEMLLDFSHALVYRLISIVCSVWSEQCTQCRQQEWSEQCALHRNAFINDETGPLWSWITDICWIHKWRHIQGTSGHQTSEDRTAAPHTFGSPRQGFAAWRRVYCCACKLWAYCCRGLMAATLGGRGAPIWAWEPGLETWAPTLGVPT